MFRGDDMFTIIIYALAVLLLVISFLKDTTKTKQALLKAWKSFEGMLPQLSAVLIIIGLVLAILDPNIISRLIGSSSGWIGMVVASIIGSITLIPGFVAFPLAAALLEGGAGFVQIAVFISTLMMVGLVTMPLEIKYFGKKATILRNSMAFALSFVIAMVIGVVLS